MDNIPEKCFFCKKKSHFLCECRCGKKFCVNHRLPEKHNCTFDYREYEKNIIRLNNPKVVSEKITKI